MAIVGMLREVHFWSDGKGEKHSELAALGALCPACGFEHRFRIDLEGHGHYKDNVWEFNGDYDKPTFSPSMGANLLRQQEEHPVCHSFVQNGQWKFLDDSTHHMAGQTVDMIPPDPDMTWKEQHGWHLLSAWKEHPAKEN